MIFNHGKKIRVMTQRACVRLAKKKEQIHINLSAQKKKEKRFASIILGNINTDIKKIRHIIITQMIKAKFCNFTMCQYLISRIKCAGV